MLKAATSLVVSGLVSASLAAQQPAAAPSLIFDKVTVIDVEQGKLVPDRRVLITGNRIEAVGDAGTVKVPKGATIVDADGKYLIPGLWDMHVHTTADMPYPLLIANGVTGIRDAWSYVPLDSMVLWWKEILAGTRVGPPRQLLNGEFKETHTFATEEYTEEEIAARKARGANFLKLYPFESSAAEAARRVGIPFGGHVHGEVTASEASDGGMSIIDHLNSSGGLDILCVVPEREFAECQPVAERLRRNGTWLVPTLVAFADRAGELYLNEPAKELYKRSVRRAEQFWADTLPTGNWLRDSTATKILVSDPDTTYTLKLMEQANMPLLAGTDSDVGPDRVWVSPPGFAIHLELAMGVAQGLSPLTALQSATINPAKMLHATDSLGTIAPGKLADLVLLDANPLADITNTTTVRAVVANGRYFDRAMLDQLMVGVQAHAKRGFKYWWEDGERPPMTTGKTP